MIFRRAKLRLALSFAAVQLLLFAVFGFTIYGYVTSAFDFDRAESDAAAVPVETAFATLRVGILIAYLALVVVIPLTSYGLASLAMRPIRASFEAQQRFVDDASHELRTPLSAIQAQLELGLSRTRTPGEYRATLARTLGAAIQLNDVLDDLLVLSRGAQDSDFAMREIELGSVVIDALAQLSPGDAARVTVLPHPDYFVMAAPSMLARAIVNVLANAVRYSPPTQPISVSIRRRAGNARLVIEDRGTGMSKHDREHAFDRFWRADSSRSSAGRGLGLSIVLEIVRLHAGRVELSSEPGAGTTVSMEIPLSR
jgi:signal transduction histidine kinase